MIEGQSAYVKSDDAIAAFRARLLVYLSKARPLLEDAQDEVTRAREWVGNEQWNHWQSELHRRKRALESAQQALFAARFSTLRETSSAELAAVEKARRAVGHAEEKLRIVKRWRLEFDHRVLPLLKHLDHLQTTLANEGPKAAEYLRQIVLAIDAYAEAGRLSPVSARPDSSNAASAEPAANTAATPAEKGNTT
jgi:hypothetical protein